MNFFPGKDEKKKEQLVEETILKKYNSYYRLAYSYVHKESDAEDIVQNTAYKGTDFILFSSPKFLSDIRILSLGLYFFMYSFKLLLLVLLPVFTSIGIISPFIFSKKSISYLSKL